MDQVLYRNDSYNNSDGEIRKLKDILVYEIFDLENTDILEYCSEHYDLSEPLMNEMNGIIDGEELDEDAVEDLVKRLLTEISSLTGKILRYGLWLAKKDVVMNFYDGDEETISGYYVSDVILSDLGEDGILFAYETFPVQAD